MGGLEQAWDMMLCMTTTDRSGLEMSETRPDSGIE
jgi:hypothetical protein